ncbi:MAG TPA: cyclic nucleotide-binding domain-containing protein [Ktedonobacterales bacterium]|jgi:CRP-like cAMP-binding protein
MFGFGKRRAASGDQAKPAATNQAQREAHVRLLGKVPMFLDLSKRDLDLLAAACAERDFPAGHVILREGDPGVGLFVIVSGRVRVTQQLGGEPRELGTSGPGDVFGEMSLLDDLPRSATVTAVEPTRVLVLQGVDFRVALREDPDIALRLLAVLSRRLRGVEARQI